MKDVLFAAQAMTQWGKDSHHSLRYYRIFRAMGMLPAEAWEWAISFPWSFDHGV